MIGFDPISLRIQNHGKVSEGSACEQGVSGLPHPFRRVRAGRGGEDDGFVAVKKHAAMDVGVDGARKNLGFDVAPQ